MIKIVATGLLLLVLVGLTSCGVETVDQGNIGIKKVMGKVSPDGLDAGLYFTNPFTTKIIEVNTKVRKYSGATEVYTKDVQKATVNFQINYSLRPDHAVSIYSQVGEQWADTLFTQTVFGALKDAIGKWEAIELVSNRAKAASEIGSIVSESMKRWGVDVSGLQLVDISFQPDFERAVEDKVTAVQRAEQAKNQTVQIEEQAKQRIIAAEADAKAMAIKTEALKQSQDLVMYEAVQKWNGVLPQYLLGDSVPLLNIGKQ